MAPAKDDEQEISKKNNKSTLFDCSHACDTGIRLDRRVGEEYVEVEAVLLTNHSIVTVQLRARGPSCPGVQVSGTPCT